MHKRPRAVSALRVVMLCWLAGGNCLTRWSKNKGLRNEAWFRQNLYGRVDSVVCHVALAAGPTTSIQGEYLMTRQPTYVNLPIVPELKE